MKNYLIHTNFGDIAITGNEDNEHHFNKPPLLILDLGGDDNYKGAYAQADRSVPLSIVIDCNGADRYESHSETMGTGSAFCGCSALIDLGAGSDCYIGGKRCFGFAFAGISVIYNASGDTQYKADSLCFGAANYGIGLSIDREGNDQYETFHSSMGFGGLGGIGVILNSAGNDTYIASATPLVNPSAQLPDQNFSGSQGFGIGLWGSMGDGISITGGLGIAIDNSGDDTYQASVFSQGAGYAFGIGILADFSGSDQYETSWYGMGSAAHQACGFLIDATGNDTYIATHFMTGGAGIDLSLGYFADLNGNDTYKAKNSSFGFSLDNAFALFFDERGNDHYQLLDQFGFGFSKNERASTLRGLWPTYSFFIDHYGNDRYETARCKNNLSWIFNDEINGESTLLNISFGIDLE